MDFWLKEFGNFISNTDKRSLDSLTNENFYESLNFFLSVEEYAAYRNDIHWSNKTTQDNISSFRVMIGLQNFSTAVQQIEAVDQLRALAKEYPYYNLSSFYFMYLFVDQYEEVLPNTLQEIYGGTIFMILIAVFFIPSAVCTLWVVLAILSIDAGVFGLMTFWDINLDVISMICIILSIGFSVDFTAHIAYSFVVIKGKTTVDKATAALESLAWPIVQGGLATTMGVVVLAGSDSYIQVAFCKTVFIVIFLGLVHGLVFLPVVLSVFSCKLSTKGFKLCCKLGNSDDQSKNNMQINTISGNRRNNNSRPSIRDETVPEDPAV